MKIMYNFKANNNTNSYNDNYSYANELKSSIANNLANKYPWLGNTTTPKTYKITYNKPSYSNISIGNFDTDYAKAIAILDNYAAKKHNKSYLSFSDMIDEYDFEIDGTPIRIFDDMIQIGNSMFLKNAAPSYYYGLTPDLKKTIINITIKLNK